MKTLTATIFAILLLSVSLVFAAHHHKNKAHHHANLDVSNFKLTPTLALKIHQDKKQGWNVQLITENFRFAPEHVNNSPVDNEGHAHLYINGDKTRIYGKWYHIKSLPKGKNTIKATLNANNHAHLVLYGQPIESKKIINVK